MSPRLIHALQFELTPTLGMHSRCLIVWPDKPNSLARPVDRQKHWLEVEAGDEIFVSGKRCGVLAVQVVSIRPP